VELCEGFLFGFWITVGFGFGFDGEEVFGTFRGGGVFVTVNASSKGRFRFGCGGDGMKRGYVVGRESHMQAICSLLLVAKLVCTSVVHQWVVASLLPYYRISHCTARGEIGMVIRVYM